jgi:glutamate 5-kinase
MRVIAKIGTSSVTDERGRMSRAAVSKLADEIAVLNGRGHEVIVVSSGAVAAGIAALDRTERPADLATLQALSAAGQSRLMEAYNAELGRHGLVAAQVLLDPHDFVDRRQYLHARQTLLKLLELGCVPVVNENDAIANEELRYGDNDRLAALVAHTTGAEVLVLLTDLEGLFTADPRRDATAALVSAVCADDPLLAIDAGSGGSGRGSGGMASKLAAARIASWSGVRTVIARASAPEALVRAVDADGIGTTFEPHERRLPARKLWIAFASQIAGSVVVDDGARQALIERPTSLLPAGVVDVLGAFDQEATVDVVDTAGTVFARGMVSLDSDRLRTVAGRQTRDLPTGVTHEVIHRDDLVVLPTGT